MSSQASMIKSKKYMRGKYRDWPSFKWNLQLMTSFNILFHLNFLAMFLWIEFTINLHLASKSKSHSRCIIFEINLFSKHSLLVLFYFNHDFVCKTLLVLNSLSLFMISLVVFWFFFFCSKKFSRILLIFISFFSTFLLLQKR